MTEGRAKYLLGVDTGGTFTDFVLWAPTDFVLWAPTDSALWAPADSVLLAEDRIRIHKCLSTPAAPEQAILEGIAQLGLTDAARAGELVVVHGSTVATNAALEGKGVRTLFITNRGFGDMLTIGRQTRRELYNLQPQLTPPPVPPELCLETGGRVAADGSVIDPLTDDDLQTLRNAIDELQPQAVAINLLFSFLDNRFEKTIEAVVPEEIFCSRSSFVLPEYKEYERGMATWLNAWLGPLVASYLQRLETELAPCPVAVMQSSGGTIDAAQASRRAVNMLLSGPAGGLAAASYIGDITDSKQLLTFDMGGTSTDVALVAGDIQLTSEGRIGPYPVAVPMVDMHTIGAGGGSIAMVDAGGLLQVGPQSAGAVPGPACYGKGGKQATVTDANLVLGRLRADAFLGGGMQLDVEAAQQALASIAGQLQLEVTEAALGIVQLANEHMAQALRVMSVQRGIDPRELTLVSFGGAGGLHVCALAEALGMREAMVPMHAGVLSALGMLVAPRTRQLSQTLNQHLQTCEADTLEKACAPLIAQGRAELLAEGVDPDSIRVQRSVDLRYQGQSYYLNVPWTDIEQTARAFHALHAQRYGHALEAPLEIVNVRVALLSETETPELGAVSVAESEPAATIELHGVNMPACLWRRDALAIGQVIHGPGLITETISTTYLAPGWEAVKDQSGNLLLTRISTH